MLHDFLIREALIKPFAQKKKTKTEDFLCIMSLVSCKLQSLLLLCISRKRQHRSVYIFVRLFHTKGDSIRIKIDPLPYLDHLDAFTK